MNRIEEIKKMLKTDKQDSFLTYALALEHEKVGNIKEAISIIEELIKVDPAYLGAYYRLGALYESKGKFDKAISIDKVQYSSNFYNTSEYLKIFKNKQN